MATGFKLYNIRELYEEPASLYCVFSHKNTSSDNK